MVDAKAKEYLSIQSNQEIRCFFSTSRESKYGRLLVTCSGEEITGKVFSTLQTTSTSQPCWQLPVGYIMKQWNPF
jgi:hypothetical protein